MSVPAGLGLQGPGGVNFSADRCNYRPGTVVLSDDLGPLAPDFYTPLLKLLFGLSRLRAGGRLIHVITPPEDIPGPECLCGSAPGFLLASTSRRPLTRVLEGLCATNEGLGDLL